MRILVTAGPTREFIDPVRFLSNPSTGRMGFAVARAARLAGHEVTLVAGPVSLRTPKGVRRIDVVSAAETGDPSAEASRKCREKGLDLVVANDVTAPGAGFGVGTNRVTFVRPDGTLERLPLLGKDAVARRIVRFAEGALS